jgi:hypothetical protein
MKKLALLASIASSIPGSTASAGEPRPYLVSIEGLELAENEFVDGFAIDTWGVEVLAICRLPPGWEIRAGRRASPDGVLAGEASHGVTFLNRADAGALRGLALVRLEGPVNWTRHGDMPATFAGRASIGRYGSDERRREQALTRTNIRIAAATRCPEPDH